MTWMRHKKVEEKRLQDYFAERHMRPEELPPMQWWYNTTLGLEAFVGREWCGGKVDDPLRWHISVRGESGTPEWSQMAEAAHAIRPGVFFVIMIPPKSWWMNIHPNVLHLWETDDPPLVEEARVNAQGHTPT